MTPSLLKTLQCFLTSRDDPYFLLAPLKMEIVSEDPVVHVFHQILTEGEMELMKQSSMGVLNTAILSRHKKRTLTPHFLIA